MVYAAAAGGLGYSSSNAEAHSLTCRGVLARQPIACSTGTASLCARWQGWDWDPSVCRVSGLAPDATTCHCPAARLLLQQPAARRRRKLVEEAAAVLASSYSRSSSSEEAAQAVVSLAQQDMQSVDLGSVAGLLVSETGEGAY